MKTILNILLGVLLVLTISFVVYAAFAEHPQNPTEFDPSVSLNLWWGYLLFGAAVAAAILCAVVGMFKNPSGIVGTIVSLLLVVGVVGVSYFIAAGHNVQIPDLQTNGFFDHGETVITETSVLVTYVAMGVAFVTAIVTEVWSAFK